MKSNLIDQADEKWLARAVSSVLKNTSEEESFGKLLERIELCINNHGDYFEHFIE